MDVSLPVVEAAFPDSRAPVPAHDSSSDGNGSGVDWAAEARRALRAYEIRGHQPPSNHSVSGDQADVWLRQAHHAGDRLKTVDGDWIVWLDARCYRVATSGASNSPLATTLPPVICAGQTPAAERPVSQ